ncbi:hypothetical protein PR003_g28372 [Phytophthora rubi]|uniref:Uncharacterized protein n=1 Tax=Phytophthora rubi TaxID=129364 RepID=A0A6A3HR12_9STRA|nr:hypothetical protein PR002_g27200 [Phytophthora rubi]KAE8971125.1 hypothetical protein PR001_g26988 [Phytophthora rubi]KAE9278944.1 hypothetical protein PR003_g28372 [Phytophthora rubi]
MGLIFSTPFTLFSRASQLVMLLYFFVTRCTTKFLQRTENCSNTADLDRSHRGEANHGLRFLEEQILRILRLFDCSTFNYKNRKPLLVRVRLISVNGVVENTSVSTIQ